MIAAAPLYLYCEAVSGNDDSTIFVLQQRFGLKKSSVTFAVSFCNNYMSGLLRIMWWRGSCVWIINASVSPRQPRPWLLHHLTHSWLHSRAWLRLRLRLGDDMTLNLTLCIQWTARSPGFAFTLRTQNIKYNYLVSDYFSPGFFRLSPLKESKWKFSKVHAILGSILILD